MGQSLLSFQRKWKTDAKEGRQKIGEVRGDSPSLHPPCGAGPATMALPASPPPDVVWQKVQVSVLQKLC